MKRRFTILTAAFALLAFLAIPMGMMGQTRESYTATYAVTDLEDMFEDGSSYASANGYWKVPESAGNVAMISIPITQQPTSDISVKFHIATFGSGTNPAATNTTITAVGTESNSNWSGTGVSAYPSSSTYVDGVMTIAMPNNPTTLSGLEITMGVSSGVKIFRLQSITVEYTYGGGTPTPTTYTVTYDCNGGTSGCPENVTDLEAGDEITLADGPVKTDYVFAGWSDGNTTYDEGDTYTVNGNVTFTAQWTEQASGEVHWVLTDLANLTTNDVFVIVGNNGSNYAMKNTGASNSGPAAVAVTVSGSELTGTIGDDIRWNISGDATNGYIFYPNGSSSTWLYCIDNNNGLRIGSGNTDYNTFKLQDEYIYNNGRQRYVGIYSSQDWRSYTSINNNIKNQTFAFYKKVTGDVLPPIITANNVSFDYNTTSGEIEYSISNPVATATLIANTNDSWLTLGAVGSTSIPFTCLTNAETTARTATVTLSYVNGEATLVTKEVTVTQGAAPVSYTTIPDLFAAATSTETPAYVTFNNWVVSGVSTNGKNVFVTDNNGNGFVIYGSNMSDTYTVGDILSGTAVSCTLKKYNGFAELINLDANDLTITSGGTVSTANVAMADLAGVNTGALLHYEGLTCVIDGNKTNLTDGTTTIQVYNALYAFDALEDGKTYNITGVYQQYNNTKEILPRSAADIEVAPSIVVAPASVNVNAIGNGNSGSQLYTFSITCENLQVATEYEFGIQFYDATGQNEQESPSWIVSGVGTNDAGYVVNLNIIDNYDEARYAYFKVHAPNNNVEVYSNLVTINQAAAPQQYTLVIHNPEHVTITAAFGTDVVTNAEEADLLSGTEITLTFDVEDGYVLEGYTVLDANDDPVALTPVTGTENSWTFNMPNSNVFVDASAVENVAPAGGNYVRITALDQLTDGSKVIIAARFDEEHTNGYYAMPGETSGKPTGVAFTSEVSGSDEIVPATITSSEDTYYWTVNVTTDGYTFTNANNQMIGYTSGTNFATGGNNTEWTISRETAIEQAMVAEYEGFVIRNGNSNGRAFAFNGQAFGAYSTSNMTTNGQPSGYNFCLDFFVQPATESISFTVTGYTELQNPDGGYCLIACPFDGVDPDGTGMITADSNYDLYKYDEPTNVWRNYKTHDNNAEPGFNLALGEGYLYANAVTTTITFSGTPVSGTTYDVTLSKTGNATNEGWNLVGNPFKVDAYIGRDFYTMNSDGTDIMTEASTGAIAPLQGVFVEANSPGETLTFTTQAQPGQKGGLTLNLSQGRGTIDRAVVRFGENRNLRKFQLFENSTKLCIAQDGEEYAVISSEAQGEMPVNFKASKNGTYTISINCEDTEFGYLHLIDNMTGADIDLIANPSYSFEANVTDYTSRFKLVFMVDEDNNNNNDNFAFVSNGQIILNGQGTVEVYDLNGRMISRNNDVTSIATDGMANGVYMIRLTNGSDVKTQKIVVK